MSHDDYHTRVNVAVPAVPRKAFVARSAPDAKAPTVSPPAAPHERLDRPSKALSAELARVAPIVVLRPRSHDATRPLEGKPLEVLP